jgi:hypothetical protein
MVNQYRIAAVTLGIVLFAAGAFAQDYIFTNFMWGYQDHTLPPSPCQLAGPAQFQVYDRSIWVGYTCTDGKVIARRFIHPQDNTREPISVIVQPPVQTDPGGGQAVYCTGIGMVPGIHGGCVPPNHPSASR